MFGLSCFLYFLVLLDAWYNIFLGGSQCFLRECTFWLLFVLLSLFSLFLSLCYFLYFTGGSFYASASETNRVGFTEFLLQNEGEGRFVQRVGMGK